MLGVGIFETAVEVLWGELELHDGDGAQHGQVVELDPVGVLGEEAPLVLGEQLADGSPAGHRLLDARVPERRL
jgi:hypothetical protein